ncbi:hypothetical protein C4J81_19265 (plasmid) [Deltaproteobacteria bacterium Smac51]|nr:hypothetical protein C4J81_19265 [Deltaproteobacteria bacterium Smac51]
MVHWKSEKITVGLFFIIYLLMGIAIHADYGISWDELTQRLHGPINHKYIGEKIAPFLLTGETAEALDLYKWYDRDYGVASEIVFYGLERAFNIDGDMNIYIFRHLLTFLCAFAGVLALYAAAKNTYGDYRIGLIAALMMILSPRMFAESFYNSKDIIFMSSCAIVIYAIVKYSLDGRLVSAFLCGLFTAVSIDLRIMGIMFIPIFCVASIGLFLRKQVSIKRLCLNSLIYIVISSAFIYFLFPFLWEHPIDNFIYSFNNMKNFRFTGPTHYLGMFHKCMELPWHYIPVWVLITTPLAYSALMIIGTFVIFGQLAKNIFGFFKDQKLLLDLIFLSLVLCPVAAVIILSSVLYDGWRQMYFIYPAFILVAIKGFVFLLNSTKMVRYSAMAVVAFSFMWNAAWIFNAHPLQNVYFNVLAGKDWRNNFEVDYWGLANREAIQYILDNDPGSTITLKAVSGANLHVSVLIFPQKDRERIVLAGPNEDARYLLTNYRNWEDCDKGDAEYLKSHDLFYEKTIDGEIILRIFKRRD